MNEIFIIVLYEKKTLIEFVVFWKVGRMKERWQERLVDEIKFVLVENFLTFFGFLSYLWMKCQKIGNETF